MLVRAEGDNKEKFKVYKELLSTNTEQEYLKVVEDASLDCGVKERLKETL